MAHLHRTRFPKRLRLPEHAGTLDGMGGWPVASGRAGGSAEAYFRSLHAAWWRRTRWRFRDLVGVGVGGFVLPISALAFFSHQGVWWFDAGFGVGALVSMAIGFKENPPEHIERLRTGFQG